jgi:hypothetical protein
MDYILEGYSVNETTWFCLSLLLTVAVFFRFNRLWSLRNLDLVLLLSISPALLMLRDDPRSTLGYSWLFGCTGLFLLRLFLDPVFRRRPLLEQNLNPAGLTFLCVAAFAFQVTKVATEPLGDSTRATVQQAQEMLDLTDSTEVGRKERAVPGPATKLLSATTTVATKLVTRKGASFIPDIAARVMACLAHLAVVLGLVMLGRIHLGDVRLGVAMATLYLLLPCTAYDVNQVDHVLPAAFVVWALTFYHRPMIAGSLMGFACGTVFFPAFLLPLWVTFYGRNGALRFGVALAGVAAILIGTFALTANSGESFLQQTIGSIDWSVLQFRSEHGFGFWKDIDPVYRVPVMACFLVLVVCLTIFPRKKNIEHLMAHSAAIVVATQFWYPQHGSVYVLWYLPILLTVVFRPRLTHLVAPEAAPLLRIARETTLESRETRKFSTPNRQQLR